MAKRRITTADYRRIKRKKSKNNIAIFAMSLILILLTVWALITTNFFVIKRGMDTKKLEYSTNAFGTPNKTKKTYEEAITVGKTIEDENTSDNNSEDDPNYNQLDYEVPETSLAPVEEIIGENLYNSEVFVPVEEIAGKIHFDKSVFIGESRTEGLVIYSGLTNINAFCYKGLSVDKAFTDNVINVPDVGSNLTIEEAIGLTQYDNYYIMFGVNELGWVSIDTFIDYYNQLIDVIYNNNPNAIVYVENVIPVSKSCSDGDSVYNMDNINKFNDRLKKMVEDRGDCIYLDLAAVVSDDEGYLPEEGTIDGKHCNVDYCMRIIQYIRLNTFSKK